MTSLPADAATVADTVAPSSVAVSAPRADAPVPTTEPTRDLREGARPLASRFEVRPRPPVRKPAPVSRATLVLRRAASLRGRPYRYGAAGPRYFDCSGFTSYVFRTAVGRSLPHSSAAQYRLSHKIAKSAIRPGDLVFFVSYGHVYHVGIYAGHGLIWHAPHTGDHVRLARISTSSWVAGRVL